MKKKLLFLVALLFSSLSYAQFTCPTINGPFDGDMDVPVDTEITWNLVEGVQGYQISIGTTLGGSEIVDRINLGATGNYKPPFGLPENTDIYITITLFFFDADNIVCTSETFKTEDVTTPPSCTTPLSPAPGSENVDVSTPITWEYAPKATGYNLTIATMAGGSDILNNVDIGDRPFYELPTDLPFNTEIFVHIVPNNENGTPNNGCAEFSFNTGNLSEIPDCTKLTIPRNGEENVLLASPLEWLAVEGADGYRVSIGTSPNNNDILDDAVVGGNRSDFLDFLSRTTYFVKVVPFNDGGRALGCIQESFSTILGCDLFMDTVTGEMVTPNPEFSFPDKVSICLGQEPAIVQAENTADGYRWFKVNKEDDTEELLSEQSTLQLTTEGTYRIEIYNIFSAAGSTYECAQSKEFQAIASETATVRQVISDGEIDNLTIEIDAIGLGDYEYALSVEGPYQQSPFFSGITENQKKVYIMDKNGCGITEEFIFKDPTTDSFPKFFTPDGDGINDYWQFVLPEEAQSINVGDISIYDRYGVLIKQMNPSEIGWDGLFNGKPLPSSDYWFTTISLITNKKLKGHFTLKR